MQEPLSPEERRENALVLGRAMANHRRLLPDSYIRVPHLRLTTAIETCFRVEDLLYLRQQNVAWKQVAYSRCARARDLIAQVEQEFLHVNRKRINDGYSATRGYVDQVRFGWHVKKLMVASWILQYEVSTERLLAISVEWSREIAVSSARKIEGLCTDYDMPIAANAS